MCTLACRSHLYAGQSAIAKLILELHHRLHQSTSCISPEKVLGLASPFSLFAGYAPPIYSAPPFIPSSGLFQGIPSFLLVQWWCHAISCWGSASFGWANQSALLPPRCHFAHALCVWADYSILLFSSSFRRENISKFLSSFILSISYAIVHAS